MFVFMISGTQIQITSKFATGKSTNRYLKARNSKTQTTFVL